MLTRHRDWRAQLRELNDFVSSWFSIEAEHQRISSVEDPSAEIPRVLAEFMDFLGGSGTMRAFRQNRLIPLTELQLQDNPFLFYVENQGVYLWSTERSVQNPPVYGRRNEEGDDWRLEKEDLAGFLCQACMFEAIMQAPHGALCAWCERSELDPLLQAWTQAPFSPWRWPAYPSVFYQTQGALAFLAPNGGSGFSFWCGAQSIDNIAFMKSHIRDSWKYCSF